MARGTAEASFHLASAGDTEPIQFSVTPAATQEAAYAIQAVAHWDGHFYRTAGRAWATPDYDPITSTSRSVEDTQGGREAVARAAHRLRDGTGDLVPEAIEGMGARPHLITASEITSGDLSAWNVIVIGIPLTPRA